LAWLHQLEEGRYKEAAHTLEALARGEEEQIGRKKTMLSMAKLSALASDGDDDITAPILDSVEHQLITVAAQEQMPRLVLTAHGLLDEGSGQVEGPPDDPAKVKVFTPRELIEVILHLTFNLLQVLFNNTSVQ